MNTWIIVKSEFIAQHRWKDAPQKVAFLRNYHRHIFKVELYLRVKKLNRELEFFLVKEELDNFLEANWAGKRLEMSCEMIAEKLLMCFEDIYKTKAKVSVFEDGENGALCE